MIAPPIRSGTGPVLYQNSNRNYQQLQQTRDYATLGNCFNQQNINGWTGVPLISTAATNRRTTRKYNNASHQSSSVPPPSIVCPQAAHTTYDENTLSKLAQQTHGMPLISSSLASVAGSQARHRNRNNQTNFYKQHLYQQQLQRQQQHHHMQHTDLSSSSAVTSSSLSYNNTLQELDNNSITSSSSSSSSSLSSSGDTCLPRIIKPRKRRKKDRKPPPQGANATPSSLSALQHSSVGSRANSSSSLLPLTTSEQSSSSCYCRLCDPSHRIWAFPLRRSFSDNTPDTELHRSKDVGVIGSNRPTRNGSFSDDSGIFDFAQNGFGFAESLLTESINEISKKLGDSSSDCSSVFSDPIGGNKSELLFSFGHLKISDGFNGTSTDCPNNKVCVSDDDDDGNILLSCLDMVLKNSSSSAASSPATTTDCQQ